MAERSEAEVEQVGGWLRLVLTTTTAALVPLWLMLTATIAQLSPVAALQQRPDGTTEVVLVPDWWGAAGTAAGWLLLALAIAAPLVLGWQLVRGVTAPRDDGTATSSEGGLPADATWEVVRTPHDRPDEEPVAAGVPDPVGQPEGADQVLGGAAARAVTPRDEAASTWWDEDDLDAGPTASEAGDPSAAEGPPEGRDDAAAPDDDLDDLFR